MEEEKRFKGRVGNVSHKRDGRLFAIDVSHGEEINTIYLDSLNLPYPVAKNIESGCMVSGSVTGDSSELTAKCIYVMKGASP